MGLGRDDGDWQALRRMLALVERPNFLSPRLNHYFPHFPTQEECSKFWGERHFNSVLQKLAGMRLSKAWGIGMSGLIKCLAVWGLLGCKCFGGSQVLYASINTRTSGIYSLPPLLRFCAFPA